ncbi:MAG: hypothetical protein K2K38_03545, partial [Clostridia bacterium]|nr:hypothetical protein [Clostridia bacterium]
QNNSDYNKIIKSCQAKPVKKLISVSSIVFNLLKSLKTNKIYIFKNIFKLLLRLAILIDKIISI